MNLDLLKKLIRLANNNPNDNEANLAARKVCVMIAQAEEKEELRWGSKSRPSPGAPPRPSPGTPPHPPQNQYNPFAGFQWGFQWDVNFESIFDQMRKKQEAQDIKIPFFYKHTYNPQTHTRSGREKHHLPCKTCGKEFLTAFVGVESQFQCHQCYFTECTLREQARGTK